VPPAVERETVLPDANVQLAGAYHVCRHPVGQNYFSFRMHLHDETVHAVEQRTVLCIDGIDVSGHVVLHEQALHYLGPG
jgi:hypothetical protein